MSANSLESLLARMKGGSITHGWGAIAAFGQVQLNRLLQEQYLAGLQEGRLIPPLTGEVFTKDRTESMKLDSLMLGQPKLSFKKASLNHSNVTLTMNIVAGSYTAISRPVGGGAHRLLSSFSIDEGMGYKVEMEVSVNQIEGDVTKQGHVTIDVSSDLKMTCNLGGLAGVQEPIAAFIQSRLAALPEDQRTLDLGLLNLSGNNPLSPTRFYLRTQKLPGSNDSGGGALLMFMLLNIDDENGSMPVEGGNFPFVIPDDQAAGKPLYSAVLVVNEHWLELVDDKQLEVLKNLVLPGANMFVESPNGRHTPRDLLVLGNLKETEKSVTIEPSFINLKAGKNQTFTAHKPDGSTVSAQWRVSNPINPLSVGTITPAGGVYTSPVSSRVGREQQPIVVSAQTTVGGVQQTRSALMLGVFESMSISPRVCTSGVGNGAAPVQLTATAQGGGTLSWPTLDPAEGTLKVIDNNNAIYTPPADLSEPLGIQTIKVTDSVTKETIEAAIVLIRSVHTLPVDPPYIAAIDTDTPIQFYADLEPEDAQWTVIGEGEVDENGVFTPPAQPKSPISLVRCSYLVNNTVRASGFSIIQLTERKVADPVWTELHDFSIVANEDQCFSNGVQQMTVTITIETKPVKIDGQDVYIPVSEKDLATLVLVDKLSGKILPFVRHDQEGIEYGSREPIAVNKKRNRFRLFSPTAEAPAHSMTLPTPRNNGVRYRRLYVHLAAEGSVTLFARFTTDSGPRNSNDDKGQNYEITVRGIRPPTPAMNHYELTRERASQDPDGYDYKGEPGDPIDYFNMYRWSIDYRTLHYRRSGSYPVLFTTMYVEDNISTIQYESELIEETFCSYTGCAFYPAKNENSDSPAPEGVSFDPYILGLARLNGKQLDTAFVKNKEPAPGELMVSLHRVDDFKYWYDGMANGDKRKLYRQHLDPAVIFVLRDEEGNIHKLRIGFESPTQKDSRNTLIFRPA